MKNILIIVFISFVLWLIINLILFFIKYKKTEDNIIKIFKEIDKYYYKRIKLLYQMMDIIKQYKVKEFDLFNSKLYDYVYEYKKYEIIKKININKDMILDIKKVLLFKSVYPEILYNDKYTRLEKRLLNYNKYIMKWIVKYNENVNKYNEYKDSFFGKMFIRNEYLLISL